MINNKCKHRMWPTGVQVATASLEGRLIAISLEIQSWTWKIPNFLKTCFTVEFRYRAKLWGTRTWIWWCFTGFHFCFDSLEMYQSSGVFKYMIHCKGRCKQTWNMFCFCPTPLCAKVKHIVFVWNWLILKMGKQDKVNNVSRVEGCGDIQLVKDVEIVRMFLNGNAVLTEATTS